MYQLKKKSLEKSSIFQLYQFSNFETRRKAAYNNENYNLNTIKALLGKLGNPQDYFKSIHIAGSKGKGSVAYYLSEILFQSGVSVGATFSPHVIDLRERFYCNGRKISFKELELVASEVLAAIKTSQLKPTLFDAFTAIAFTYFRLKKVSLAVVETGLGGRWDSTNVLKPKNIIASVITQIDKEHTDKLGNTLKKIALEKVEIIKRAKPVFFIHQSSGVNEVITQKAQKEASNFYAVKNDNPLIDEALADSLSNSLSASSLAFLKGNEAWKKNFSLVLEILDQLKFKFSKKLIKKIILSSRKKKVFLGRYQKIDNFILDGAHSPLSIRNLVRTIKSDLELKKYKKVKVLFYFFPDKPFVPLLKSFPVEWELYFTDPELFYIPQASRENFKVKIRSFLKGRWNELKQFKEIEAVYSEDELFVVTGSFRLVGWFLSSKFIQKLAGRKLSSK